MVSAFTYLQFTYFCNLIAVKKYIKLYKYYNINNRKKQRCPFTYTFFMLFYKIMFILF